MDVRRIKRIFFLSLLFIFTPSFLGVYGATLSKPANNLGLVGYWSFNEATGTVATDFSGNRNNGTLVNMSHPASATSGWGGGYAGNGVVFDGVDDYVTFDGVADNVTQTSFSISMWVKTTWTAGFFTLWAVNTNTYGNETQIYLDSTNFVKVYDGTSDAAEITSSILVGDNKWHHVVYTRSGSTGTLYVDGVSQGTHTANDTFSTNDLWSLGQEWDAGPTTSDFFKGNLDEVRVYSRVLGQSDITALYASGGVRINSSVNNLVPQGLIGYWTFDGAKMTSTLAYDSSSYGSTLSFTGATKTTGKVGQSLNMDAVDDEVYCTDANCGGTTGGKYDMGTRDWTVMAWIYPENGATSCNISGRVASKIGDDELQGWFLGIANSYICASIRDGGTDIFSTLDGSQVTLNAWNHIAVVFDRDGNMTRYINGVQTGTQDSIASYNGISIDHSLNFCIGGRDGGAGCIERMFDGRIDEVRIYERVVTASEIKQIYNASAGAKVNSSQNALLGLSSLSSGLVGYWSFNGTDATDRVYDRSGQGNDGYVNGRATSTLKTIGKVGQALNFDGTSDYIYLGTPASLFPTSGITLSAWINPDQTAVASQVVSNDDGLTISNQMRTQGASGLRCSISNTTSTFGSTIPAGEWTHVACVYDGVNIINYINGVSVGSTPLTGSISYPNSNTEPWRIGRRGDAAPGYFDGKIDEVRIYNRGLTASEIKQLYLIGR